MPVSCIVLRHLDICEVELNLDFVYLGLHDVCECYEVLVDHKCFFGLIKSQTRESLQDLGNEDVKGLVNLDQVLEHDEDHILEEPGPLAEAVVLIEVEDLLDEAIEVLIVSEEFVNRVWLNPAGDLTHAQA